MSACTLGLRSASVSPTATSLHYVTHATLVTAVVCFELALGSRDSLLKKKAVTQAAVSHQWRSLLAPKAASASRAQIEKKSLCDMDAGYSMWKSAWYNIWSSSFGGIHYSRSCLCPCVAETLGRPTGKVMTIRTTVPIASRRSFVGLWSGVLGAALSASARGATPPELPAVPVPGGALAETRYRTIDPAFGHSAVPSRSDFHYTHARLSEGVAALIGGSHVSPCT